MSRHIVKICMPGNYGKLHTFRCAVTRTNTGILTDEVTAVTTCWAKLTEASLYMSSISVVTFCRLACRTKLNPIVGSPSRALSERGNKSAAFLICVRQMLLNSKMRVVKEDWIYDMIRYDMIYFINCSWVATRWQQYSTHLHTNSTQNDTKQTIHRKTQTFRKSADRAPSLCITLAFALQLRKKHGKISVRVAEFSKIHNMYT
jgi:hypothetical protein